MRFITIILLGIIALAGGCSQPKKDHSYKDTMAVIDEYSKGIKSKEKLRNSSYGLYYAGQDKVYDGKIHVVSLGYRIDKNMQYEEARNYFYSVVDGLVAHINKNPQIGKYFFHYPIDYSDLEFHLTFEDDKEGALKRDDVHSIHINNNHVLYQIVNEEGPNTVEHKRIGPDVYVMKGLFERNRSIRRTIPEDLALHSK